MDKSIDSRKYHSVLINQIKSASCLIFVNNFIDKRNKHGITIIIKVISSDVLHTGHHCQVINKTINYVCFMLRMCGFEESSQVMVSTQHFHHQAVLDPW